jgi:hypothetical protein
VVVVPLTTTQVTLLAVTLEQTLVVVVVVDIITMPITKAVMVVQEL